MSTSYSTLVDNSTDRKFSGDLPSVTGTGSLNPDAVAYFNNLRRRNLQEYAVLQSSYSNIDM